VSKACRQWEARYLISVMAHRALAGVGGVSGVTGRGALRTPHLFWLLNQV